jgi:hypothetical protein
MVEAFEYVNDRDGALRTRTPERWVYNGEPLGVRGSNGDVYLQFWQDGYELNTSFNVYVGQDGSYSAMLFDGVSKLVMNNNRGPWVNSPDTVTVEVKGSTVKDYSALEPNKTRLLRVDTPIYVFHGKEDANVPVESVYDLEARFKACNRTNLKMFVFDRHNHDLNFQEWIATKKYSEGLQKLFEVSAEI